VVSTISLGLFDPSRESRVLELELAVLSATLMVPLPFTRAVASSDTQEPEVILPELATLASIAGAFAYVIPVSLQLLSETPCKVSPVDELERV
jgi:hypothetical protein